jgi:hypothetical protein
LRSLTFLAFDPLALSNLNLLADFDIGDDQARKRQHQIAASIGINWCHNTGAVLQAIADLLEGEGLLLEMQRMREAFVHCLQKVWKI